MFIHFGLYSLLGRGEWVMNRENIPVAEYEPLADQFAPRQCDPRAWARLAREAGMKYMVLTTKHHEGFCLFDSRLTDYTSVRRAARRDIVREYADACRAEGLKVGFYFSLMDWHHPDGDHRGLHDEAARRRFIEYVHGQVRELMTNYGPIDLLWYDVPYPYTAAGWESARLNAMVRALQPGILINNRSRVAEDFGTPEQEIKGVEGDWEACMTLNDNWGFHHGDTNWKSAREVVMMLAQCSSDGGNLLLNVGPDADGVIPAASERILREVGGWLQHNGEAIYGRQHRGLGQTAFGRLTARDNTLYLVIDKWHGSRLTLGRVTGRALRARLLHPAREVAFTQEGPRIFLSGLPAERPDSPATVIAIEMDQPPGVGSGPSTLLPTQDWLDVIKASQTLPEE